MLYRIYEIDLSERVVAPPRSIICDSDEEAAREAKQLVDITTSSCGRAVASSFACRT
jgi:hypothetical protein